MPRSIPNIPPLCYNTGELTYKYLYQDSANRPYRVIGDDPWNWRPWAISAGYLVLSAARVVVGVIALSQARQLRELQMLETEDADYWGKGR